MAPLWASYEIGTWTEQEGNDILSQSFHHGGSNIEEWYIISRNNKCFMCGGLFVLLGIIDHLLMMSADCHISRCHWLDSFVWEQRDTSVAWFEDDRFLSVPASRIWENRVSTKSYISIIWWISWMPCSLIGGERNFLFVRNWKADVDPLIKAGSLNLFWKCWKWSTSMIPIYGDSFPGGKCGRKTMVLAENSQGHHVSFQKSCTEIGRVFFGGKSRQGPVKSLKCQQVGDIYLHLVFVDQAQNTFLLQPRLLDWSWNPMIMKQMTLSLSTSWGIQIWLYLVYICQAAWRDEESMVLLEKS